MYNVKDFETDFIATTERLFDLMGLWNRTEREELENAIAKHTIYRKEEKKMVKTKRGAMREVHKARHATDGLFSKEEQIEILLGQNGTRCGLIKQWTDHMKLEWKYADFC